MTRRAKGLFESPAVGPSGSTRARCLQGIRLRQPGLAAGQYRSRWRRHKFPRPARSDARAR
eukprot:5346159-Prymnesium_polylepis.2